MKIIESDNKLTPLERRQLDSAMEIAAIPAKDITYLHTAFTQAYLPKRRTTERVWERSNGALNLSIEAGRYLKPTSNPLAEGATGEWVNTDIPYGTKARLILMHLNNVAIKTQSRQIDVQDNLTSFCRLLQSKTADRRWVDGRTVNAIKNQLLCLSRAKITIAWLPDHSVEQIPHTTGDIVAAFNLWLPKDANQRLLWPSELILGEYYFESLIKHAVPLDLRAIGALSNSADKLDIYAWLSQRLHRITQPKGDFVAWARIHEQFGSEYKKMSKFREKFLINLNDVLHQYPDAKVKLVGTKTRPRGLQLLESRPPVSKKMYLVK